MMDENTKKTMFSKKSDEWSTPREFFDKLNDIFHFTLDPCATHENHKCEKYYTIEDDGLNQDWAGETAFVNPPYSDNKNWSKKVVEEGLKTNTLVAILLPARVETRYYQDLLFPNSQCVLFVRGRLKFGNQKNSAPFPSAVCIISSRELLQSELVKLEELGRVLYGKGNNLQS